MANTSSVTITLTLNSTGAQPPYNMSGCLCAVTLDDGSTTSVTDWTLESIPHPPPNGNGADFTLKIIDDGYNGGSNPSSVAGWALTFLPRPGTSQASPFGNNQNTLTGGSVANANSSVFTLNVGNAKIKQSGKWDWVLIVQMNTGLAGSQTIKCFASDPEMDVEF